MKGQGDPPGKAGGSPIPRAPAARHSLCESGSVAHQGRGPASQRPLRFGVGSGIHVGERVSGPTRTGPGPRGRAGLCPSAGWTDSLRHSSRGTSLPPAPDGRRSQGVRRQAALRPCPGWSPTGPPSPVRVCGAHGQACLCPQPRRPVQAPAAPRVPRLSQGRNLAMGLGTKQSNTWVTGTHRQARGSPGHAQRPSWPQFPHLLQGTAGPPGPAGTPSRWGHKLGTGDNRDSSQLSGSPP